MHGVLEALSEPRKDWRSGLQHQVEKPCEQTGSVQCLPPTVSECQVAGVSLQIWMEMTVFLDPHSPFPTSGDVPALLRQPALMTAMYRV